MSSFPTRSTVESMEEVVEAMGSSAPAFFLGKTFPVLIDAHSKWIEAMCVLSPSFAVVIDELRTLFAKFGLPETIVTDNDSGFVSQEFNSLIKP